MPDNRFTDCDSIEQVLGEAVGAGSMCWENIRAAGVFDSEKASQIVTEALAEIRRRAFGAE